MTFGNIKARRAGKPPSNCNGPVRNQTHNISKKKQKAHPLTPPSPVHGLGPPIPLLPPRHIPNDEPKQHAGPIPNPRNLRRRLLLLLLLLLLRARSGGQRDDHPPGARSRFDPTRPAASDDVFARRLATTATGHVLAAAGTAGCVLSAAGSEAGAGSGPGYDGHGGTVFIGLGARCYRDCDDGYQSGRRWDLKWYYKQSV